MDISEIQVVYENGWIIDRIYEESDKLLHRITNPGLFEDRCIKDVAQYLNASKQNRKNKNHIIYLIKRKAAEAVEIFKQETYTNFSDLTNQRDDAESEEIDFEPKDVLANVESTVINKETADLLAQDDCRRKKIIEFWTDGNTNSKFISRTLASSFGGNEESHRKYIQRFRQSCREQIREQLSVAI